MPFVFKIGFFLALSTLCLSCPLRTLIRKKTRLVPLKVRKVYFSDPDKLSPLLLLAGVNGPTAAANNLMGGYGSNGSKADYAKLPAAITNGPLPSGGGLRNSHQPGSNHVQHHLQQPHLQQQQLQQHHQQKVLLDAALGQNSQQYYTDASKQQTLNTNTHNAAETSGDAWPMASAATASFSSKLTPKDTLPAAVAASPLAAFPPGSIKSTGAAKYVLLSPMYGSRSLLLSPVVEAAGSSCGSKQQQQQSGFIILPVETLGPHSDWAKEQTRLFYTPLQRRPTLPPPPPCRPT